MIFQVNEEELKHQMGILSAMSFQAEDFCPTDAELEKGQNWELVNSTGDTKQYIAHKAIPIARIISLG